MKRWLWQKVKWDILILLQTLGIVGVLDLQTWAQTILIKILNFWWRTMEVFNERQLDFTYLNMKVWQRLPLTIYDFLC
jgi:hypothetical protein